MTLIVVIELAFLLLFFRGLAKFAITIETLNTIQRRLNSSDDIVSLEEGKKVVVLLKVFQETDRAADIARRLHQFISIDKGISAIVVGTDREKDSSGNPTLRAIDKELDGGQPILLLEATSEYGRSRPGQINFALERIPHDAHRTWILHIDADTIVSQRGVTEVLQAVNSGSKVIQQSSIFMRNFQDLSYMQKGHALLQSRWTFSHELLRLRLAKSFPFILTHIVGHGSCIQLAKLREYGEWPQNLETEDIELGFYFCASGEPVKSLSSLNDSDSPTNALAGFKQEVAWSFGALNYFIYPIHYVRRFPNYNLARLLWISFQGLLLWLNWMLVSWIVLLGIIAATLLGSIAAMMFLMVLLMDYFVVGYFSYARSVNGGVIRFAAYVPTIILALLRRSLSANFGLVLLVRKGRLHGHKTR